MRTVVLGLALSIAPNSTLWTDELPPERYAVEGVATVFFLKPENVTKVCGVAVPDGMRVMACAKRVNGRKILVMPLPNEAGKREYYAQLLSHLNGWPGTHGD